MRLFIAVAVPKEVKERLVQVQRALVSCGGMRAVEPENIHLSLKFLGEVDPARLDFLKSALSSVNAGNFDASVTGVGVFPGMGNPRIVWAGIGEGFKEIVDLAKVIDVAMEGLEFQGETRFHPHLSLARLKGMTDHKRLQAIIDSNKGVVYGTFQVGIFHLMESKLSPQGPKYGILHSFPLG